MNKHVAVRHGLWRSYLAAAAVALTLCGLRVAHAEDAAADPNEAERKAAGQAVRASQIAGPADIKLKDQAVLKLPAGYIWVPEPAASRLMRAMGNRPDDRELGLVFPQDKGDWLIVAEWESAGYVKDDDARNWNVDDLYKSIQEGTEASNEDRRQRGFSELELVGWVEKPNYDAGKHQLVWSIAARHKGAASSGGQSVNYNTYALGRDGYVTLDLVTDMATVEQDKAHARALLSALEFNSGKRYADFNSSTDHVAAYGVAALVGGLAAKKLGLLALGAAFFVKFAKLILIGAAGVVTVLTRIFKRK